MNFNVYRIIIYRGCGNMITEKIAQKQCLQIIANYKAKRKAKEQRYHLGGTELIIREDRQVSLHYKCNCIKSVQF